MINKITVIGVGLIGGSLARALKEKNLAKDVFGYGRDQARLEDAQKLNIIDQFSTSIEEAIVGAEIIVIATQISFTWRTNPCWCGSILGATKQNGVWRT